MIVILEDNPDKLANLLLRYRERFKGKTLTISDTVTKAQYAVQKLVTEGQEYELWLDEKLLGGSGLDFLDWLCENQYKPNYMIVICLGLFSKDAIVEKAKAENITHSVWAGPFG